MTLLETITKAVAAADEGKLSSSSAFPIILNADDILPTLTPESDSPSPASLVTRVSGWRISATDSHLSDLSTKFSKTLARKLKNPRSFTQDEFLSLLNSFLAENAESIRVSLDSDPSDPGFTRSAIGKLGFLLSREVAGSIAEACVVLGLFDILEALIRQSLVSHLNSINLVEKLAEKNRPDLLCLYAKHASDLRTSELLLILKSFLSPSENFYEIMVGMRKEWESEALLAIDKATRKGILMKVSILAREAAVLLMMAHDGFSSAELCLHHVFGSSNFDSLVLSSAVARLDGSEVLGLARYFTKWLDKYRRFPEAMPCPAALSVLGLRLCESVPSLEAVGRGLGLVWDEHFSYLVLNSEFHDEMRVIEEVVSYLVSEAESCCRLDDILRHLEKKVKQHGDF